MIFNIIIINISLLYKDLNIITFYYYKKYKLIKLYKILLLNLYNYNYYRTLKLNIKRKE